MKTKISITRALRELKLLNSQIESEIGRLSLVSVYQDKYKGKELKTNTLMTDFEKKAISGYDSVDGLIKRHSCIKSAIILSNAQTILTVADKTMTVAEAIDTKKTIEFKKKLLSKMNLELTNARATIAKHSPEIEKQLENLLQANSGKDKKVDREDYEKIAEPFIKANEIKVFDPVKIEEKSDELRKTIEKFEADIDIVLSESNSKTEIEV